MSTTACAMLLTLMIDISGSVSYSNFELQRDATARVIESPALVQTIEPSEPLAVTVLYWSTNARVAVDWTIIDGQASATAFANRLRSTPRGDAGGMTYMGRSVSFALDNLDRAPCVADKVVIDVSGDGASSGEPRMPDVRDEAIAQGVTINGLPILADEPGVDVYYRENVVTPSGFIEVASSWEDFARAIRAKLVREVAGDYVILAQGTVRPGFHNGFRLGRDGFWYDENNNRYDDNGIRRTPTLEDRRRQDPEYNRCRERQIRNPSRGIRCY
jgi:Protein of unknown function (DUF1194)